MSSGSAAPRHEPPPPAVRDGSLEHFASVLLDAVDEDGLIRYQLLTDAQSAPRVALDQARDALSLGTAPAEEKALKAELINAFNLSALWFAVSTLEQEPALKSVRDIPGYFDSQKVVFRSQAMTLRDIEQRLLAMGDPRVFAAIVRGARSCPPLRREPYLHATLDQQLDDQCRVWLDDPSRNRTLRQSLGLSEIFQWYDDAFDAEPYLGTVGFVRKFSRPHGAIRDFIIGMKGNVKVTFLPYDWRLNRSPMDEVSFSATDPFDSATRAAASQPDDS